MLLKMKKATLDNAEPLKVLDFGTEAKTMTAGRSSN